MWKKPEKRRMAAEWSRIFGTPLFWASAAAAAALKVADCYAEPTFGIARSMEDGFTESALYYLDSVADSFGLLSFAVICLCTLPCASMYAEDSQKNALVPRVQRMGALRYAASRAAAAGAGAFLAMLLADLLAMGFIAGPLGQDWILAEDGNNSWLVGSVLLEEGRMGAYAACMLIRHGLEAAFYSLVTMGMSAFLANRQVLVVLPFILKYAGTYCYAQGMEWMYPWIPRWVYGTGVTEGYLLGITEVQALGVTFVYTLLTGGICCAVLYLKVSGIRPRVPARAGKADKAGAAGGQGVPDRREEPGQAAWAVPPHDGSRRHRRKGRGILSIAKYELYMMVCSAKFWVVLLMAVIFMKFFLGGILDFAGDYGLTLPPAALVFYYSDKVYCNVGMLMLVFLVSDAPFREDNQVYLMERCGRAQLCAGQLLSLCAMSVLFTMLQFMVSSVMLLPRLGFGGWGKVWGSIAAGTTLELGYDIQAEVSADVISAYGPLQATASSLLLVSLMGACYGMVLYLLNRVGSGKLGTVVLGIWSVMWLFLGNLAGNVYVRKIYLLSPNNWLDLGSAGQGGVAARAGGILIAIAVLAAVDIAVDRRIVDR